MKRRGPPHISEQVAVKIPYEVRSYLGMAYANQPYNISHFFNFLQQWIEDKWYANICYNSALLTD